jgi:hypothetical protein
MNYLADGMTMHNLIVIGMTVIMAYAFFGDEITVKPKMRGKIIYCEGCRKQKNHLVIEKGFFECTSCERQIDLRTS